MTDHIPDTPQTPEPTAQPEPVSQTQPPGQPEPTAQPDPPTPASVPTPGGPRPGMPSPALLAAHRAPVSEGARFGRVAEDGVVYVSIDGVEQEVGSYPGASPSAALAYFVRKFDEVSASADLLAQRISQPDVTAKDVGDALGHLAGQAERAHGVGDWADLRRRVADIREAVAAKRSADDAARRQARTEAAAAREQIVAEAESIAATPEQSVQWKSSTTRMRALFEQWQAAQKGGPRLDKDTEAALWKRFSSARNAFDKMRRGHFSRLDETHGQAKVAKQHLVDEAERLAQSSDWNATAKAFAALMSQWREAGRAGRSDDDALWSRFKTAQDTFFARKDEEVAAQDESYRGNLTVKEGLLEQARALLPVTDLESAKSRLRAIQDKWDAAGKVPRADIDRMEKGLRSVEQAVRGAEDHTWSKKRPENAARAQSFADQLETAVAALRADLATAEASGDERRIREATAALQARETWLQAARAGVDEFGG